MTARGAGPGRDDVSALEAVEHREHIGDALRLRAALTAGYLIWPSFFLVDYVAARLVQPEAMWWLFGLRAALWVVVTPAVVRLRRPPLPSRRLLTVIDVYAWGCAALTIALMCAGFGGLTSAYAPGFCVALVARNAFVANPLRRALVPVSLMVLAFPIVMLAAAPLRPEIAAQLHERGALGLGLTNLAFIVAVAILTTASSHASWNLRRRAFDTRFVGPYELLGKVGAGGMGEVWRARRAGGRPVALKVLNPTTDVATAIVRFRREVAALARLRSPHVVRVLDYGVTDDGLLYYAMELLEGDSLRELVTKRGPIGPRTAVGLARELAAALAEAHAAGFVHRDVKPDNVLLERLGDGGRRIKLVDFGIARSAAAEEDGATQTGLVVGTPAFMAPEAARGAPADARSDVYAAGAVLFYLLTGAPPFTGAGSVALLAAAIHAPPPAPSGRVTGIPPELDDLVLRCLAKAPDDRFAHGAALEHALAALSSSLPDEPPAPIRPLAASGEPETLAFTPAKG